MKRLLLASCAAFAVAAHIVSGLARGSEFRSVSGYPFRFEAPTAWENFPAEQAESLRFEIAKQSSDLYKRYSGFNDSNFSTVPYLVCLRTPDSELTFIALVMRIPPQTNYLASVTNDLVKKMEWGKQNGIVKEVRIAAPVRVGNYDSFTIEAEKPNGGQDFVGMLFDEELPYQVVQLTLLASRKRASVAREAFDHILKTIKIDYTLRGIVGNQPFVISKKCQEFFVVTEISNPGATKNVFVVQEPHWNYRGQWNLHQGLRVFFNENTNLMAKSVFLSEGVQAGEQITVSALTRIEPEPEPMLMKAALESCLVTGYLTFN